MDQVIMFANMLKGTCLIKCLFFCFWLSFTSVAAWESCFWGFCTPSATFILIFFGLQTRSSAKNRVPMRGWASRWLVGWWQWNVGYKNNSRLFQFGVVGWVSTWNDLSSKYGVRSKELRSGKESCNKKWNMKWWDVIPLRVLCGEKVQYILFCGSSYYFTFTSE